MSNVNGEFPDAAQAVEGSSLLVNGRFMNEEHFDGVIPENEAPEEVNLEKELRFKALLLLLIFLIPTLVILYELLSGQITGPWMETVQPHLPQMDQIVTF